MESIAATIASLKIQGDRKSIANRPICNENKKNRTNIALVE